MVAIIALIALGAGMGIGQVFRVTRQNNDANQAVRQAQFAGYWISEDALAAEAIMGDDPGTGDQELLTTGWVEWETGNVNKIYYRLIPTGDSLYKIQRKLMINGKEGGSSAAPPPSSPATYNRSIPPGRTVAPGG